jgi:hypothetical protein
VVTTAIRLPMLPIKIRTDVQLSDSAVKTTYSFGTQIFPERTSIPGRPGCSLKRAVVAQVETTKDGFVVASPFVDEEAFGDTHSAAALEFLNSLCDRFHSLSRRGERLSEEDRTILERLRSILQF